MNESPSFRYLLWMLFWTSLSLCIPLMLIGAPGWIITIATLIIFSAALCGNAGIAYIYRVIHNIILRPSLYIWALIVTISGPQDIIAIGFYIIFALQLKNIIGNFIGEIILLLSISK